MLQSSAATTSGDVDKALESLCHRQDQIWQYVSSSALARKKDGNISRVFFQPTKGSSGPAEAVVTVLVRITQKAPDLLLMPLPATKMMQSTV